MEIRKANLDDATAIASVLAASFPEYKSLYTEKAYAATTPSKAVIENRFAEGEIWIAKFEEKIVGTVSVVSQNESLYIRSMAILPEARGHQIGEHLLSEIRALRHRQRFSAFNSQHHAFSKSRHSAL